MKKEKRIMIVICIAVLVVILSPWSSQPVSQEDEGQETLVEEAGTGQAEGPKSHEEELSKPSEQTPLDKEEQADQEPEEMEVEETEADQVHEPDQAAPERPQVIVEPEEAIQEPEERQDSEAVAAVDPQVEPEVADVIEGEASKLEDQEAMSSDEVDAMEEALSASDYARGLTLLAQLPVETVDRFVELRKDGFTAEEQAEIKTILLATYEGEDLDWIVEVYHKLQP
jgi:type IV secretory pathway VirB10-like protein